jgi:hypothetical protein
MRQEEDFVVPPTTLWPWPTKPNLAFQQIHYYCIAMAWHGVVLSIYFPDFLDSSSSNTYIQVSTSNAIGKRTKSQIRLLAFQVFSTQSLCSCSKLDIFLGVARSFLPRPSITLAPVSTGIWEWECLLTLQAPA